MKQDTIAGLFGITAERQALVAFGARDGLTSTMALDVML
ncbi:hypothetical protein ACVIGA_003225 [Bradyrhizobium sp. USDA 3240]